MIVCAFCFASANVCGAVLGWCMRARVLTIVASLKTIHFHGIFIAFTLFMFNFVFFVPRKRCCVQHEHYKHMSMYLWMRAVSRMELVCWLQRLTSGESYFKRRKKKYRTLAKAGKCAKAMINNDDE